MYEDIDKSLDVMYEADEFWHTVGGPTAPEYWTGYENGNPCLDNDDEPITIIANSTKSLRSTVFVTKPDEHGERRRARMAELTCVSHKCLEAHEQRDIAFHSLQFWYIYDHPIYLKNRLTSICLLSLESLCSLPPFDGEFWLNRLLYEQQPKKTNKSNSNDIINCNDRLIRRPRTKSSNKKADIRFLCQRQQRWMLNNNRRCKKAAI